MGQANLTSFQSSVLLNIYNTMVKIRMFEEEIARRWPEQQMRSPPHFCAGQEAIAASVCAGLELADQVIGYYRGHGYYLAKGGDPKRFIAEMYCKVTGSNEGKGGSMLLSAPEVGYVGSSAIVAGGIPIATGLALAAKKLKNKKVVVCFFGDAAIEEGVTTECLNFSALMNLPIVFVCENNSYAVTTHITKRQASPENICKHAEVFGIPSFKVDGNNPQEIYALSKTAVKAARNSKGPSFIEAITYRWFEHVGEKYDDYSGLRTKKELSYWMKKDPIVLLKKILLNLGILDGQKIISINSNVKKLIHESFEFGINSHLPSKSQLLKNVY